MSKTREIFLLDGALGTTLLAAGMPAGVCPEAWILEEKIRGDLVYALARSYAYCGARFLYTPTFGANRAALAAYGLEEKVGEFNRALAAITHRAADDAENKPLVCGDLSPTGKFLRPMGDASFAELIDIYEEQIRALDPFCDAFCCETNLQLSDARACLFAARNVAPEKPFFASFTVENGTRTLAGTDLCAAAVTLFSLGAKAVGVNCSKGPEALGEVIRKLVAVRPEGKWILCKPNAGLPDETGAFSMSPEDFASRTAQLCSLGADLVGGCCGTTPEHLRALAARLPESLNEPSFSTQEYLACERQIFPVVSAAFPAPLTADETLLSKLDFSAPFVHLYVEDAAGIDALADTLCYLNNSALCFSAKTPDLLKDALMLYQGRAAAVATGFSDEEREEILRDYAPIFLDPLTSAKV